MRNIYTLLRWIFYCYVIIWAIWLIKMFFINQYFMYIFYLLFYVIKYTLYWYSAVFFFRNKRTIVYFIISFCLAPFLFSKKFLSLVLELVFIILKFKRILLNLYMFFFNSFLCIIKKVNYKGLKNLFILKQKLIFMVFFKVFLVIFSIFVFLLAVIFNNITIRYFYVVPYLFKYFLFPTKKYLRRVWLPFIIYLFGWIRAYILHISLAIYVLRYNNIEWKRIFKRWLSLRGVVFWLVVIFFVLIDIVIYFSIQFLNVFLREGKSRRLLRYYDGSGYLLGLMSYFHQTIELFNFSLGFYIEEHLEIYLPHLDRYLCELVFEIWPMQWSWVYYLVKFELLDFYKNLKAVLLFCWVIFFVRNGIMVRDCLFISYIEKFFKFPIFHLKVQYVFFEYELSENFGFYTRNKGRQFKLYVLQFFYKVRKLLAEIVYSLYISSLSYFYRLLFKSRRIRLWVDFFFK